MDSEYGWSIEQEIWEAAMQEVECNPSSEEELGYP